MTPLTAATVRNALAKLRDRHTNPEPAPRPNPTRIAVLEHDLYGIQPEPGTPAALTIALRRTGTCITHDPVEITSMTDNRANALCTGCGAHMIHSRDGGWRVA
jgi:hypothetical protein